MNRQMLMQTLQMIKSGQNPEQLVMNLFEQKMQEQGLQNNPLYTNLLSLAKSGNTADIEAIARNITKERGGNFDTEFQNFKKNLGI